MSWRSQGATGSNNVPLGPRRRFGGDDGTPDSRASNGDGYGQKRGRSPIREGLTQADVAANIDDAVGEIKRRKKRNRWGVSSARFFLPCFVPDLDAQDVQENKAAGLMGLPTAIMSNMTSEQLDAYTLHLRIEEISQKLRINDVVPADGDRSPSPPPQYDNFGKRVNTREHRYKKRLEEGMRSPFVKI